MPSAALCLCISCCMPSGPLLLHERSTMALQLSFISLPPHPLTEALVHVLQYARWQQARAGLAKGLPPTLAEAGCGGSYFIPDPHGRRVAVFKPTDEEPLAVNNPRGACPSSCGGHGQGYGLRKGICPGEGAVREVNTAPQAMSFAVM